MIFSTFQTSSAAFGCGSNFLAMQFDLRTSGSVQITKKIPHALLDMGIRRQNAGVFFIWKSGS